MSVYKGSTENQEIELMKTQSESDTSNQGAVLSVRGSVIDAYFPERLPSLYNVLRGGEDKSIVIEVLTHLDSKTVRGIALTSTLGLAQGAPVLLSLIHI